MEIVLYIILVALTLLSPQLVTALHELRIVKNHPCAKCRHAGDKLGDSHCLIDDHPIYWKIEREPCRFYSRKGDADEKRQDPKGKKAGTQAQAVHQVPVGRRKDLS